MTNKELLNITGGVSATTLNAISRTITTLLSLGQIIGTAIKRSIKKNYC